MYSRRNILICTLILLVVILTACNKTTTNTTTHSTIENSVELTSLSANSDKNLEAEFSNGVKIEITDFSPKPLVSDKETLVTFRYNNKIYQGNVTWSSSIKLVSLIASDANTLRAQFSDGEVKKITDFSPKPLENGVETEVIFSYSNITYAGKVTWNALSVKSIKAIDPITIEVEFSNNYKTTFTDFTPNMLQNGVETTVTFTYLNVVYNEKVTWIAPNLTNLFAVNANEIQATFDNGKKIVITDFNPRPLPYEQNVNVTINYFGVSYTKEVFLALEAVNILVSDTVIRQVNPGHILGGNMGAWVSASKLTNEMVHYVQDTGAKIMRFPGGNLANSYCWKNDLSYSNWDTGVPYVYDFTHYTYRGSQGWTMDTHDFLAFIKKVGAVPMYSVNPFDHYKDGVKHDYIDEAVELVKLFKNEGFIGAYYEIGNENMGSWNPMLTLEDYTEKYILLAEAIKAEDPQAKIMGPVTGASDREWFHGFVTRLVERNKLHLLNYLTFHFYGNYNMGVELDHPQTIRPEIEYIRNLLDTNGGEHVKIAITEYNSALWGDELPNDLFTIEQALWTIDFTGEMLINEVDMGNIWITLHPASDPHAVIDDRTSKPSKNYWASYLVSKALSGSDLINVLDVSLPTKSTSQMTSYVVDKGNGDYGIFIVNKEDMNKKAILTIENVTNGYLEAYQFTSVQYDANVRPIAANAKWNNNKIEVEVPAYGIIMINIHNQ